MQSWGKNLGTKHKTKTLPESFLLYLCILQNELSTPLSSFFRHPFMCIELFSACCDLIERCLDHNPRTRCTLQDILEHPWMQDGDFSLPISSSKLKHGGHVVPDIDDLRRSHAKPSFRKMAPIDPFGRLVSDPSKKRDSSKMLVSSRDEVLPLTLFYCGSPPTLKSPNVFGQIHRGGFRYRADAHSSLLCAKTFNDANSLLAGSRSQAVA